MIYFVRPKGSSGPIKIGCSRWPESRIKQIGFDVRSEMETLACVPGDFGLESGLHRRFNEDRCDPPAASASHCGKKEWFNATPALLAFIDEVNEAGCIPDADILDAKVAFVRRRAAGDSCALIAKDYGVSRQYVHSVIQEAAWREKFPLRSAAA